MKYWWVLLIGLTSCVGSRVSYQDYSGMYDNKASVLHPEYRIHHSDEEGTQLYVKVNTKELLYTRPNKAEPFNARVRLTYQVLNNLNDQELIDSATHWIRDEDNEQRVKDLISQIPLRIGTNNRCVIRITTADANRKQENIRVLYLDKSPDTRQHFLVQSLPDEVPLFDDQVAPADSVEVRAQNGTKILHGRYYSRNYPLALPPFSVQSTRSFRYEADSTFTLEANADSRFLIEAPERGFIHLLSDTASKEGLTLYVYDKLYPEVGSHEKMLEPLRYLTSNDEYERLINAPDPRKAIEEFWLDAAGSKERAREVIRQFYGRIQNANEYFTSYIEGWKTDRGLIHIIYGHPNTIYKTEDSEVWIYGEEHNINSITFNFAKLNNPFTEGDYTLRRSPTYKTSWYRAIDSWRNGRVFSSR